MIDVNEVNNNKESGEAFSLPRIDIDDKGVCNLVQYNGKEEAIKILSRDTFKEEFARELVELCLKKNGK